MDGKMRLMSAGALGASLLTITPQRWLRLLSGLACFGLGIAFMKQADLGLGPWDVLADGLSFLSGMKMGTIQIWIGVVVLLLWVPIREKPGIGTILNILLIGNFTNLGLAHIPMLHNLPLQAAWLAAGLLLIGLGSALYLGSRLGAGPRDGLMVGLCRRMGWSVRLTRTLLEVSVLALGWLLGGTVGLGTLVFAFGIGPIIQWMFRLVGTGEKPGESG
jgi:uncharacterized membrane protein YczE